MSSQLSSQLSPQLNADGELTHLLTLEGLPPEVILRILDTAVAFVSVAERDVKKVTLLDTIDNLVAMNADMFVVRHAQSGAPHLIAQHLSATAREHIHVINAGDGRHAH